jgi:beta-1,4-mannooligosaccharide/beta-1,4-mannosyl-N-acetylglucosamine phosphorylase
MTIKNIDGSKQQNFPWEDRPPECKDVIWRSARNPIIKRDAIPVANSIYNSAVVPFEDGYAGVFRIDYKTKRFWLHAGKSIDGIKWDLEEKAIEFICEDDEIGRFVQGYDPRVTFIEDRYYVTWCNEYYGPTIGVAYTFDFKSFYQLENAFLPFNRNGVLFPRKLNNKFAMLSRPSDSGHTPFGDIFYSESPDMTHWGCHRHVMSPVGGERCSWQCTKVGAGPSPIETSEGWLLIYHGVLTSCNGYIYSAGAALLDLDPRMPYECIGDVPNVVFPCAALHDKETGRLAIYYGAADTVTCIAYTYIDELIGFIKSNPIDY